GHDLTQVTRALNQYTEQLIKTARQELAEDVSRQTTALQSSLQGELTALRKSAAVKRRQTIARLNEALALAESLEMEDPPKRGGMIVNYSGDTAYMRGAKALRNQINLIAQRESDDDFIPKLASLAEQRARLENISFDVDDIRPALIDAPAVEPEHPIKPRKRLIMALSLMLGVILGVFIVLLRQVLKE